MLIRNELDTLPFGPGAGLLVAGPVEWGLTGAQILAETGTGAHGAGAMFNDGLSAGLRYIAIVVSTTVSDFVMLANGAYNGTPPGTAVYQLYEEGTGLVAALPADRTITLTTGGITATVAAVETGADVFSAQVTVLQAAVSATVAARESGADVFAAQVTILAAPPVIGTMAGLELGQDTFRAAVLVPSAVRQHYATLADMLLRFSEVELVQISDRRPTAKAVDGMVVDRALDDADAEIDARLQARYALPLATVPKLLVNIACDIARYRLYDDRASDQVRRRYDDALKLLDKIERGQLHLGLDEAAQLQAPADGPRVIGGGRTFSRSTLGDYSG